MDQPTAGRRIPWGGFIAGLILVVAVVGVYHVQQNAPWFGTLYAALAAVCAARAGRWLLGPVWGLALGLMVAMHPLYQQWGVANSEPLEGEAFKLLALAALIRVWQLLFRARPQPLRLVPLGL